MFVIPVS